MWRASMTPSRQPRAEAHRAGLAKPRCHPSAKRQICCGSGGLKSKISYINRNRGSRLAARLVPGPLMTDGNFRSTAALKRDVSSDADANFFGTLVALWPFIWPSERRDLKLRILVAMILLLLAKFATIAVPFTFKWATDALTGEGTAPAAPNSWITWVIAAPILMTIA